MDAKTRATLPVDSKERQQYPVGTGCLDYFPDALAAVALVSLAATAKHHPGQPMHWERGKSADHPNGIIRHYLERGGWDTIGEVKVRHSAELAWRALALLQEEIEADAAAALAEPPVATAA